MYIGFKTFFYVVRHLDSIASYLPTGLHLHFFRSWPSLFGLRHKVEKYGRAGQAIGDNMAHRHCKFDN